MGFKTTCDVNLLDTQIDIEDDGYEACGASAVVVVSICKPCVDAGIPLQEIDQQAFCLAHLPDVLKYEPGIGAYFK